MQEENTLSVDVNGNITTDPATAIKTILTAYSDYFTYDDTTIMEWGATLGIYADKENTWTFLQRVQQVT